MWNKIYSYFAKQPQPHTIAVDDQDRWSDEPDAQNPNFRSPVPSADKIEPKTRDKLQSSSSLLESEVLHTKRKCFLEEEGDRPQQSLPPTRNAFKDISNRQSPLASTRSISRPLLAISSVPIPSISPLSKTHKPKAPKPEQTLGPLHLYKQLHRNSTNSVQVWTSHWHHEDYPVMQKHLPYVVKVFDLRKMTQIEKSFAIREWDLHKLLSDTRQENKYKEDEGVLPLVYLYDPPEIKYKLMVFPYCYQGDLRTYLNNNKGKRIPEDTIRKLMTGVREALWQMRLLEIMHRDIKPENIFIYNDKCFLGDFGIAMQKFIRGMQHESVKLGTQAYSSPEFLGLLDVREARQYLCHSDYWSFAVVLFEITFGYCPFQGLKEEELESKMKQIPSLIEQHSEEFGISNDLTNLLKGMLKFFPGERYIFPAWANHSWWKTTDHKMCLS